MNLESQLLKIIEEQQHQLKQQQLEQEKALQLIQLQSQTIEQLKSYTRTLQEKHSETVKIVQKYQQIVQNLSEQTISPNFSKKLHENLESQLQEHLSELVMSLNIDSEVKQIIRKELPKLVQAEIEQQLGDYLSIDKVIWIKDGIDPEETNGHIDDVACFVKPGEVACIWTDDPENPFYKQSQDAYKTLTEATDAKGRKLKVHKLCLTKKPILLQGAEAIDSVEGTLPREDGDICIASYMNFLIVNGGVIVPQYGDENDSLAIEQIKEMFPDRKVVGVDTKEVVYGGGNVHCITQHMPKAK